MKALLSTDTVGEWLRARGVLPEGSEVRARDLAGGVSGVVLDVEADGWSGVVKQSLERFRVPDEWLVDRERTIAEAEALELAATLLPGGVPRVLHLDRDACVLVIERAPPDRANWKARLLDGEADPEIAGRLGRMLAALHAGTPDVAALPARLRDYSLFEQQRVDPYYRTVMRRRPDLAGPVAGYIDRMRERRRCLVHGDWSPKNVLAGPSGVWVVDWEVAQAGDPAFDVAFMLTHLFLKAVHRPASRDAYAACAGAFWEAYHSGVPAELVSEPPYVLGHVGCLLSARVDGKSPAEYLTEPEREIARRLGRRMVFDPPGRLDQALDRLRTAV